MSSIRKPLQLDCEARLKADPYFDDIAIILQRKGVTEKDIERLLNVQKGRGGKVGACVLVLIPGADAIDPDLPGPRLGLVQSFVVLVHPTINAGSTGTGKDAEDIAERVLQLFHQVHFGYGAVLVGGQAAIQVNDTFDGLVGQQVNLETYGGPIALAKVAVPAITASATTAPATVTITCATAGAAIRYTTDGSLPTPTNGTDYTAPFAQATAATIRATATKLGALQSDTRQLKLS